LPFFFFFFVIQWNMQKNNLDAQTLPSKKPQSFVFFCLSVCTVEDSALLSICFAPSPSSSSSFAPLDVEENGKG
jgi:hypothetical protein